MKCAQWGILALLGLAGCGTAPPMRYYTLNSIAPAQAPAEAQGMGTAPPPLRLASISLPPEFDRRQLVTHDSDNQVQIHEYSRWAAPLDEQIRLTLSNDLAARVPVIHFDAAAKQPHRTLTIALSRFNTDAHCAVSLSAEWTLQGGGVQPQAGVERIEQPATAAGDCPGAAAATISQALAVLAERLLPFVMSVTPDT
jgi:uncharacterized lipoprotein YmbA